MYLNLMIWTKKLHHARRSLSCQCILALINILVSKGIVSSEELRNSKEFVRGLPKMKAMYSRLSVLTEDGTLKKEDA